MEFSTFKIRRQDQEVRVGSLQFATGGQLFLNEVQLQEFERWLDFRLKVARTGT